MADKNSVKICKDYGIKMEAERIDNIIKVFEAYQKDKEKKEPTIAFSETLKKKPKNVEAGKTFSAETTGQEKEEGIKVDTLSLSKEAKEAYQLVKIVKIIREAPDVRSDKLEEARKEIESGRLFVNKVNEVIAEKLIH
ncbi:TPA: hypothetical protein DCX15_06085 [bacterium]|nr:hypothetical protein [bacterium]